MKRWMKITACMLLLNFSASLTTSWAGSGKWTANDRQSGRPPELWLDYMHGVVDDFAHPVDLAAAIGAKPELQKNIAAKVKLDTAWKKSEQPVLKVSKSDAILIPMALPLDEIRGRNIRFFYWLKGDKTADDRGWHAPNIGLILKDKNGKVLSAKESGYHTAGTFPWHCYHRDFFIPAQTASAELKFYNMFRGTAWITGLSWEVVEKTGPTFYDQESRQDPVTGSLAANVRYDQMPEHLRALAGKYPWNFLKGNLPGQPYDITTCAGFRKYYFDKAKKCPEHMNHAILYVGLMYHEGSEKKLLPPMEKGWYDNFRDVLMADQDPATGYWHDGTALSLGLTFHLCNMFFRYYDLQRTDREDITNPKMGLVKYVPRAKEIIRQTLLQQSTWIGPDGKKSLAAWSKDAYRYTLTPDATKDKSYLGSTWDAIYLLRLSARDTDEETRKKVYDSVKQSFRYMLEKNVLEDGAWIQQDTDTHVTSYSYVYSILCDVHWLERKIDPKLLTPVAAMTKNPDGSRTIQWTSPAPGQDALRVYLVPEGVAADRINEKYLAGVIQRTGQKFYEMDPFVAVRKMIDVAIQRFGPDMNLAPESSWQGKRYLPWKLRMVRSPLPYTENGKPLTLKAAGNESVWVSATSWYGEESTPTRLD